MEITFTYDVHLTQRWIWKQCTWVFLEFIKIFKINVLLFIELKMYLLYKFHSFIGKDHKEEMCNLYLVYYTPMDDNNIGPKNCVRELQDKRIVKLLL